MRALRSTVTLAAACAVLLAACSTQACNAMGCSSELVVDVRDVSTKFGPRPVTVTACVDGVCQSQTVSLAGSGGGFFVSGTLIPADASQESPPLRVSVRVVRAGVGLVEGSTTAAVTRFAPNGEACGPICFQARVRLLDGRVTSAPASS